MRVILFITFAELEVSPSEAENDDIDEDADELEEKNNSIFMSKDGSVTWFQDPLEQPIGRRRSENILRSKSGPTRYVNRNIDTISSTFMLIHKESIANSIIKHTN